MMPLPDVPVEAKIDVLRRARALLAAGEAGNNAGICSAIHHVVAACPHLSRAGVVVRSYIGQALGHHRYLEEWISAELGIPLGQVWSERAETLATRLAWIDWMIDCYQEQASNLESPPWNSTVNSPSTSRT